jgi:hypothetical protein
VQRRLAGSSRQQARATTAPTKVTVQCGSATRPPRKDELATATQLRARVVGCRVHGLGPYGRSASPEDSCSTTRRCIATSASAASCFSRTASGMMRWCWARTGAAGPSSCTQAGVVLMG